MDFAQVVARRRMVRRYRDDPVEPAVLARVLQVAIRGPSAGWSQGVRFVAVTDPGTRAGIAERCGEPEHLRRGFQPWLSTAPVHVVVTVREDDYRRRYAEADKRGSRGPDAWRVPYWWVDAGAALQLLLLAAVDEGLAAGFLDIADPDGIRELLGIPADVALVGLVTLGHPAPDRASSSLRRGRRPAGEVIRYERW